MALIHGGDVEGYFCEYGREPLDFSANCNPFGLPEGVRAAATASLDHADRYPDPLCRRLCAALSDAEGRPAESIFCGDGAADVIFRLALALRPREVLTAAPSFAEYSAAAAVSGAAVKTSPLFAEEGFLPGERFLGDITPETGLVFLCNPNNPTGKTVSRDFIRAVLKKCEENGAVLAVDECFNGFLDEPEKFTAKPLFDESENLVIIKAFTKIYGMAGLRLGYCLCPNGEFADRLRAAGAPWAVSSVAEEAGVAALREKAYIEKSRAFLRAERERLKAELSAAGMDVLGGEANYIFFYCKKTGLGKKLRGLGVMIRDCSNYEGLGEGYYRTAVRSAKENSALIAAINTAMQREKQ